MGDYVGRYATAASAAEGLMRACARARTRSILFDQVGGRRDAWTGRGYLPKKKKKEMNIQPVSHSTTAPVTHPVQMLKKSLTFTLMDS